MNQAQVIVKSCGVKKSGKVYLIRSCGSIIDPHGMQTWCGFGDSGLVMACRWSIIDPHGMQDWCGFGVFGLVGGSNVDPQEVRRHDAASPS